jgi:hypothetical protein
MEVGSLFGLLKPRTFGYSVFNGTLEIGRKGQDERIFHGVVRLVGKKNGGIENDIGGGEYKVGYRKNSRRHSL